MKIGKQIIVICKQGSLLISSWKLGVENGSEIDRFIVNTFGCGTASKGKMCCR